MICDPTKHRIYTAIQNEELTKKNMVSRKFTITLRHLLYTDFN